MIYPRKKKLLEDRAGNLENDKVEKSQYLEGPIYCSWDLTAMPFVYPNGDVYLCCEAGPWEISWVTYYGKLSRNLF